MKKVLLILSDNLYLTPYYKIYSQILEKNKIEYDIIFWDKNNNEEIKLKNIYRFHYNSNSKIKKIIGYIKYKKFIKSIINNNNYLLIIPLHSNVLFLIYNLLLKKFKGKYIIDIRDYSFEKYYFIRSIEKKLINNSIINVISSEGYKNFLPEGEYNIIHNYSDQDFSKYKQYDNPQKVVKISYIGLIRFMDQNKKIIDFFKNDNRFNLNFIGTNSFQLKDYCKCNNIKNVQLIDTFDTSKTLDFYKNTDLIMNLYGNNTPLLDYALSNKLYFSASLYKPILVCENTFMSKISSYYKIGYTLKMDNKTEIDNLYEYITKLNRSEYIENCNRFMNKVKIEQQNTLKNIENKIIEIVGDYND